MTDLKIHHGMALIQDGGPLAAINGSQLKRHDRFPVTMEPRLPAVIPWIKARSRLPGVFVSR